MLVVALADALRLTFGTVPTVGLRRITRLRPASALAMLCCNRRMIVVVRLNRYGRAMVEVSKEIMLRDYSPDTDLDEVLAFTGETISESPYDARQELAAYPERHLTAKVVVDDIGNLIGFCASTHPYWNNIAMIDYLVVAPSARRRGVGRQLVTAIEAELCKFGIRHVCVQTASWNDDAIRFYERLGYVRLAVFPEYLGKGNDAVWLNRSLSST